MTQSYKNVRIYILFAVIAALNVIWFVMAPSAARTADNGSVPPPLSLPFIVSQPAATPPTAPAITSMPLLTGTVGITYTYAISTTGYPTPTVTIDVGPQGMTIDENGLVQWLPTDEGEYAVTIRARTGAEPDAFQSFTINVVYDFYWDPRLDQRFAVLVEADVQPGHLYYRLIRAEWLNTVESEGRHHIYMDVVDQNRSRVTNIPLAVKWADGEAIVITEEKSGEPFAANFPMNALAPAYSAQPVAGYPADRIEGMGYGEIDDPYYAHHTSYELTWMLTVKQAD